MLRFRPEMGFAAADSDFRGAAQGLLRLQSERDRRFAPLSITGPAWDLMLVLYAADDPEGLYLGDVAKRASVPRTTGLRWLRRLQRHGYVALASDAKDKRAVRVILSDSGERAMESCFAAASAPAERNKRGDCRLRAV